MFGQISLDIILLFILYGVGAAAALIACLYLLLHRSNAFAPDVTPPVRLRRWTAAFFAVMAVGHLWYLPGAVLSSDEAVIMGMLAGGLLDCLLFVPLVIVVMLCMLQDRRRPLWPAWVLTVPAVVGFLACMATCSYDYVPMVRVYFLLLGIGLVVYMVRAVRQYGRWLRDNYADLEHKEVWQTFVVLAVIVLMLVYYVVGDGSIAYAYIVQVCGIVLICHLLWRVETLSDLSISGTQENENTGIQEGEGEDLPSDNAELPANAELPDTLSDDAYEKMTLLLQKHCIDTGLYLQHDLNKAQVAQAIGTNRTYLSLYFMRQETTYNAYINDLRIRHVIRLYREAIAAERPVTAQQLALMSGYRSYSTFSLAFKQRMDQSVTAWMRREKIEAGEGGN